MKKKQYDQSSRWLDLINFFKTILLFFQERFEQFGMKYPNLSQIIQLTFIYFFALLDLVYSILTTVLAIGPLPELLKPAYPLIKYILESPLLVIWASPEKIFFLSYVTIELMVIRSIFRFSKLVRYNILLIFALLMLQGLAISYWDLLFHREIAAPVAKWAFDQGAILFTDRILASFFFFITFLFFFFTYIFLYIAALRGKFFRSKSKLLSWLTDSICFWLRIRTSTMPFGQKKKKK
jgi:hypothetical protein